MMDGLRQVLSLDTMAFLINVYAVVLSLAAAVVGTRKLRHLWRTRHLRRVWGIKNGERVILVCSELEEPGTRQWVEPREFIYSLKYGDVDAYFEVVVTLLRLYPSIKLKIISAGEVDQTRVDLARHIILIGGPDYNTLTERVLSWNQTQFEYRSPDVAIRSVNHPQEIVLYDKTHDREYCHTSDIWDFGYFERIRNPHNPKSRIILIGGCHTIGVTGAVKGFSMAESEDGEIPSSVLDNAALVSKIVGKSEHFSVLMEIERIGQTISVPLLRAEHVTVQSEDERRIQPVVAGVAAEQSDAPDGASHRR